MSGLLVVRAGSVAWPPATVDGRPTPALHEDDLPSIPASRTVAVEVSSRALCYGGVSPGPAHDAGPDVVFDGDVPTGRNGQLGPGGAARSTVA
jgi:hypothetical protein